MSETLNQYYRQQLRKPGWQDLSALLFSDILQSADRESGCAFLRMVGRNLASRFPLPEAATLGDLEDSVNRLFSDFGWGIVSITSDDRGMNLCHQAWPAAGADDDAGLWLCGFSSVLEGCWSAWLLLLGGAEDLSLFLCAGNPGTLNFRYQFQAGENNQ